MTETDDDKIYELAKIGVDYDRQVAICGKMAADNVVFFWMKGYKASLSQIEQYKSAIEGAMRIKHLWAAPNHQVMPEFEGEMKALKEMEHRFEQLLKS